MARIEGIRIRNYRVLKDVTLGKLWNTQKLEPLTPITAVIGPNGVGKSTLFDAFGFLADCLSTGVEEACDARGRGGFKRLRSQGQNGPIQFELYYRESTSSRPITYEFSIDLDKIGQPYVSHERLRQRRKGQTSGRPYSFLLLSDGRGLVWSGELEGRDVDDDNDQFDFFSFLEKVRSEDETSEGRETETVELEDSRRLGIATLGALKQHPRISAFRRFIEGWYLSYFTPDAARGLPLAGPQPRLDVHGDNLGNVVQYMARQHPAVFRAILREIALKIPGVEKIDTIETEDGRLLLRFNDRSFQDPFYAQQVSDGTLKVFAYLIMLNDQAPPPFLCIEEPENGLYHKLLESLACEFRSHADNPKIGSQIFVTTHQPYFVNALTPREVWVLSKGEDGFATVQRASDDRVVTALAAEGIPLGSLWYSDYFDRRPQDAPRSAR